MGITPQLLTKLISLILHEDGISANIIAVI